MPPATVDVRVPELGMGDVPLVTAAWLVEKGAEVCEGDRLVEIVAGPAVYDVSAPAQGRLCEKRVGEDEPVQVGQLLGIIRCET